MNFAQYLALGNHIFDYGALWSYSPRGIGAEARKSRVYRYALKNEYSIDVRGKSTFLSQFIAETMSESQSKLPFMKLFESDPVLVPITRSTLMKPDTLWVPRLIAEALVKRGFGSTVSPSLVRIYPVRDHAPAIEHFDSQRVTQKLLRDPEEILLVDDFVTSGATMAGSALRIRDAYPKARVRCFAGIRTASNPESFKAIDDPVLDKITLFSPSGRTHRNPD